MSHNCVLNLTDSAIIIGNNWKLNFCSDYYLKFQQLNSINNVFDLQIFTYFYYSFTTSNSAHKIGVVELGVFTVISTVYVPSGTSDGIGRVLSHW